MPHRISQSLLRNCGASLVFATVIIILYASSLQETIPHWFESRSDSADTDISTMRKIKDSKADEGALANTKRGKVKLLIWVLTGPQFLKKKAIHVRDTWAHRADVTLFFSSKTDPTFPTIGLNVSEGKVHLTSKTMQAFLYIYQHHFNDADWFMKADDDTFVIVENLRYFLSDKDPSSPVFYGQYLKKQWVKQGYFSGGAGYVMSKEALRRFGTMGDKHKQFCRGDGGAEDVQFSQCMFMLGVRAVPNSSDSANRSRFHHWTPETHISRNWDKVWDSLQYMSDYAISFHKVEPEQMVALEYLIYHLKVYGGDDKVKDLDRNNRS